MTEFLIYKGGMGLVHEMSASDGDIVELLDTIILCIRDFMKRKKPLVVDNEEWSAMCQRMCPVVANYDDLLLRNPRLLDACMDTSVDTQNVHNTMKLMSIRLKSIACENKNTAVGN